MANRFDKYIEQIEPGTPNEETGTRPNRFDKYTEPSIAEDVVAGVPSAVGRVPFAIAGAPAAFMGAGMGIGRWVDSLFGDDPVETYKEVQARNPLRDWTPDALETRFFEEPTGVQMYDPKTDVGKITSSTITGAGAGLLTGGVGSGPGNMATSTASGAAGGAGAEIAGQLAEGSGYEEVVSALGGLAGGASVPLTRRAVSPRYVTPQNARYARVLRGWGPFHGEGIRNLTEGQVTQNKRLKAKELQRVSPVHETEQYEDLTGAVLRRVGIRPRTGANQPVRADDITMDRLFNDLNTEIRGLSGRNIAIGDGQFGADLGNIMRTYSRRVNDPNRTPAISDFRNEINNSMRDHGGRIPGDVYQSLRSRMQAEARALSGETERHAREALFDMTNALDDMMERSIVANNPRDAGGFRTFRERYRNTLVIEDAVTRAGEWGAQGLITPDALASSVKRWHGKRNWVRGQGPYAELSRAASAIMTPLRPTGHNPLNPGDLLSGGLAAMPAKAGVAGFNRWRMSPGVQRYLTNRVMPTRPVGGAAGFRRTVVPTLPSIAGQIQSPYEPVVEALTPGAQGPANAIDPRIQQIIDALGGAGQ